MLSAVCIYNPRYLVHTTILIPIRLRSRYSLRFEQRCCHSGFSISRSLTTHTKQAGAKWRYPVCITSFLHFSTTCKCAVKYSGLFAAKSTPLQRGLESISVTSDIWLFSIDMLVDVKQAPGRLDVQACKPQASVSGVLILLPWSYEAWSVNTRLSSGR